MMKNRWAGILSSVVCLFVVIAFPFHYNLNLSFLDGASSAAGAVELRLVIFCVGGVTAAAAAAAAATTASELMMRLREHYRQYRPGTFTAWAARALERRAKSRRSERK